MLLSIVFIQFPWYPPGTWLEKNKIGDFFSKQGAENLKILGYFCVQPLNASGGVGTE